jgi:hypothetical protein
MVMRSHATIEMQLMAEGDAEEIVNALKQELGAGFRVFLSDDRRTVTIRGDLHDYRLRNRIIRKVTGGRHGFDVQAN